MSTKQDILQIFSAALEAVEGERAVRDCLLRLLANGQLGKQESVSVVAIGKAADAMLKGVIDSKGLLRVEDALLISKQGYISEASFQNSVVKCIESEHPVPGEVSLKAGKALVKYVSDLSSDRTCLVLMSGGASSLVELLNDGVTLNELQEITQWMLANSCSIAEINAVRSRLSKIKAGGLWRYLKARKVVCLLISDVPGDDVNIIGSGMLFPVDSIGFVPDNFPSRWKEKLVKPSRIDVAAEFSSYIVASNVLARRAAADKAVELGYSVYVDDTLCEGDSVITAQKCVQQLYDNVGILHIWGAETTVLLPDDAGRGGRNQHLALAAAIDIAKQKDNEIVLLAAGTDGSDGATDDAGGLVDNATLSRGSARGLDAEVFIQHADSGQYLQVTGDLISTGVTGTNVMDLIIGYNGYIK